VARRKEIVMDQGLEKGHLATALPRKRVRLTKRVLDGLATTKPKGEMVYDSDLPGFVVMVYPSGAKVFFVRYWVEATRTRRIKKIGRYGVKTVEGARDEAKILMGKVTDHRDPIEEEIEGRRRAEEERLAEEARKLAEASRLTFQGWVKSYLSTVKDRKRSWKKDELYLGLAAERWGSRPMGEVTAEDVRRLFETVREKGVVTLKGNLKGERGRKVQEKAKARWGKKAGPKNTLANRWLAAVRACFSAAWRLDLVVSNPAAKVKLLPENDPRQRVLTDEEMGRVLDAVAALPDPTTRAAFTLLIETGARGSEVLRAKWEDMDLDGRLWRLPRPKAGKPQVVPLADSTVAMLRNLERNRTVRCPDGREIITPWIIPGLDPMKPRTCLKNPWQAVQKAAEVPDVHIHDLRRTFGLMAARRYGLHVASKLLRHSAINVTEKVYAPLGTEDLRKATNGMSKERGKVLPMRKKKDEV
jgi:integrase